MSQITERRPMKDKGEQVVAFFKEWFFGFPQPPSQGQEGEKKLEKKFYNTAIYNPLPRHRHKIIMETSLEK